MKAQHRVWVYAGSIVASLVIAALMSFGVVTEATLRGFLANASVALVLVTNGLALFNISPDDDVDGWHH